MTKTNWIIAFVALLILGGIMVAAKGKLDENPGLLYKDEPVATTTQNPLSNTVPYGQVTLKVGQTANFEMGSSITLLAVTDESRCPQGVSCIWAGTVKVSIRSVSGMGTSTETIEKGNTLTTEAEYIKVVEVSPYPKEGETISQGDYMVVFEVGRRDNSTAGGSRGACYVGGCSSEICSDQPGVASNCMYKPEFACYAKSKCERQSNGQCGWTPNNELNVCLQNPPRE